MRTRTSRFVFALAALAAGVSGCGAGASEPSGVSANGKEWNELAFIRFTQTSSVAYTWQLGVVNADGSNLRFLTDTLWEIDGADVSPDGTKILFAGGAHLSVPDSALPPRPFGLWVINIDGSGLTQLASPALPNFPRWTPDGRQILFEATLGDNIWIENSDGTSARQLTSTADTDIEPVMSPDGQLIAFTRSNGGQSRWGLFVMNADGTNVRQLTSFAVYNAAPSWSPDGKQLVFGHLGDDGTYLAVVNADGTGAGSYSPAVTDGIISTLRPDGNAIAYSSQLTGGLVIVDRATGKHTTVTPIGGHNDASPSWVRTK